MILIGSIIVIHRYVITPYKNYNQAQEYMDNGDLENARTAFLALNNYKDSAEKADECYYILANQNIEDGDYRRAFIFLHQIEDYKDSAEKANECYYILANQNIEDGEYQEALNYLYEIEDYKDSATKIQECKTALKEKEIATYTKYVENFNYNSFSKSELFIQNNAIYSISDSTIWNNIRNRIDDFSNMGKIILLNKKAKEMEEDIKRNNPGCTIKNLYYWDETATSLSDSWNIKVFNALSDTTFSELSRAVDANIPYQYVSNIRENGNHAFICMYTKADGSEWIYYPKIEYEVTARVENNEIVYDVVEYKDGKIENKETGLHIGDLINY